MFGLFSSPSIGPPRLLPLCFNSHEYSWENELKEKNETRRKMYVKSFIPQTSLTVEQILNVVNYELMRKDKYIILKNK